MTTPQARTDLKRWVAIGSILVLAAILSFVFARRFGVDPRVVDSPLIGAAFPEFSLPYLESEGALENADIEGKIAVVNFWASYCMPCRAEHPALTAAAADYEELGVSFVGVVHQDQPANASRFLDQLGRGVNYEYIVDEDSRLAVELGVFGIPETFIVDRDGTIRYKFISVVTSDDLRQRLDEVLSGLDPSE